MTNFLLSSAICLDSATIGFKSEKRDIFLIPFSQDCCTNTWFMPETLKRCDFNLLLQAPHHDLCIINITGFSLWNGNSFTETFFERLPLIEIQSNVLTCASVDDKLNWRHSLRQLWLLFWKSDVKASFEELGNKTEPTAGKPRLAQFA